MRDAHPLTPALSRERERGLVQEQRVMVDFLGMMKKAQEVQAKLAEAQEELGRLEIEGQSGGGMVKS